MDIYKLLNGLDFAVMGFYLICIVGLGAWISMRGRKQDKHLFLAQHSLGWPPIGLSMWGTNVGPSMLIASCSIGFTTGIVAANFSWLAFIFLFILAMVFAPFYRATKVETLPQFIGLRFNSLSRELLAWYSLVTVLVSWLALTLYAGGLLVTQVLSWPLWLSIAALAILSAFFTLAGGLKTVAYTNVFQMSLLIFASGTLVIFGLVELGSLERLASETQADYWKLFLPSSNEDFPWHAILLGYPVLGIWFWCTDQSMVQTVLGAKSQKHAQLGTNFCGWLKVLDMPLFILPGIICLLLFPTLKDPDTAYMTMVTELLPHGLIGLIMSVLLAALVSTIASALNSFSTIFTLDIYLRRFRPEASTVEIVRLGRIATLSGAVLSVFLAIGVAELEGLDLFSLFQAILGFLAPPLTAVFLLGVFWKRSTAAGANAVLTFGTAISLGIGVCYLLHIPNKAFWPHFMTLSFLICAGLILLMVIVSLLSKPVSAGEQPMSLGQAYAQSEPRARSVTFVWSVLILLMLVLYLVFN